MTIANPIEALFTPEDLLRMEDQVNFELVDGKLVERHMGLESSAISARIIMLIGVFIRGRRLGQVFSSEAGFQCFPDAPSKVRRPDVSFIRADRIPDGSIPKGHARVAPDLAVEVVSPGDLHYEVEEKVVEYLRAGVPLVWVVNPPTRTVRIHRPRTSPLGPVAELTIEDTISGEDVLPGFSARVADFFE